MKVKRCNCTYNTLVKRGFKPLDHAWSCPLNRSYIEPKIDRMDNKNDEQSPYKEIWLDKEDIKKYESNQKTIKKALERERVSRLSKKI